MGQPGAGPAGPNPPQQPPANQYPATRVQPRPDAYPEPPDRYRESGTVRDPDPYPDRYHDDPYPDRYRDPDPYDDRYDDRYREPERDRHRDRDPYPQRHRERDPYEERRSADRGDRFHGPSADAIGRTIQVLSALISLVFVLHIVFVVTGANQSNDFVSFTYSTAKFFVLGLGDVFTPEDATIGVVLNYGLAAVIYLVAGRIIARALKR
ncbi:hypothetical protein MOQ72_29530 [Saccharopolyspora sp. K220]|uniref:hypothetical protein n=1 Tax=Saccharopolyspora soli TaxID=2926618 RepID=UPI001F565946|nr:hypothetical protein [Saccharopolyspora soli]MCI2421582.1 hypothetical protein [Saccharopolyspora soli]